MTISPHPLLDLSEVDADWPDEVLDLTDRRRLLVRAVFGVDVGAAAVDAVFAGDQPASSGSTTMRSAGRSSSTDDT